MTARAPSVGMWLVALLALALAGLATIRSTRHLPATPFGDFNHLVTGAECLLDGCNPYAAAALNREAAQRHEAKPNIWAQAPVYPPSSMLVVLPFARLGWPQAAELFNSLAGIVLGFACVLMIWSLRLAPDLASGPAPDRMGGGPAALILVTCLVSNPLCAAFRFANPALLCTALAAIACLLLLRESPLHSRGLETLAWIVLGIALALKPQMIAAVAILLLCLPGTRRPALKALALSVFLLLAGCLAFRLRLGSFQFLAQLRANIDLSLVPGGTSDFSPANSESFDFLNLQTGFSRLPHVGRSLAQALGFSAAAALALATWLFARKSLARRPWTLVALAALIGVMPVYHRGYDRVIALLLVPAAIDLWQRSRALAWAYTLLACVWIANDTVMTYVLRRWRFKPQSSIEGLLLCLLLLASLALERAAARRPEPAAGLGSIEA